MMRWLAAATFFAWTASAPALAQGQLVDLELVLAVDVSSSVDAGEYELQMSGIAAAFRHPDVLMAIEASTVDGIAVTVLQWSDAKAQAVLVEWTRIANAADAARFSERIRNSPRVISGGSTAIGAAIYYALAQIQNNAFDGGRRTIDVSGDGRNNSGPPPWLIHEEVEKRGVTVNGLAIANEQPFVDIYYEESVVSGESAFVMRAEDYEDFERAMAEKLIREIGLPLSDWQSPSRPLFACKFHACPPRPERLL
tara:strand:+ start:2877 stop:3635 length:759 start_codon:yes stop_codon:yes gene_type:complete